MEEQKRFQNQELDSKDYEPIEEGAKLLKNGGKILAVLALAGGSLKRYGPEVVKGIKKLWKDGWHRRI